MRHLRILAGMLSLLLLTSGLAFAQEADTVQVIGSGIVNSLLESVVEAGARDSLEFETVGTAAGIDRFCNGDFDIATAIRAMTSAEGAICGANDVVHSEFLLGHYILALLSQADAPVQCLTNNQLEAALKPSASNLVTNWSFYDEALTDLPLTLFAPREDGIEHLILDSLIAGDGLRVDAQTYADPAEVIAGISETAGSLGFAFWSEQLDDSASVALLQYGADAGGQCLSPSVANVENGRYDAALSLYLIVNRERLGDSDALAEFMRFIADEANAPLIAAAGAHPPSDAAYAANEAALSAEEAAYGDAAQFDIPAALSGSLRIVGAANAFDVLDRVADSLTQDNASLEIMLDLLGRGNGLDRLCAGEADIAILDADSVAAELEACANNSVVTTPLKLGRQATVLLGNAADEYSACLTAEQIATVWRAESAAIVDDWSKVEPSFPAEKLTLFGPSVLDQHSDFLLQAAGGVIPPIRQDTEKHFDPLYRAAAVGNVNGALTYMNWPEYQRVLNNDQANIRLVAVDAGAGCVTPSPTSIAAGSYALSHPATLLIRQESLAGINTQSYLWTLFSDGNLGLIEREGFVGISAPDLPAMRRQLQTSFAEAEAIYLRANSNDSATAADDDSADAASDADSE
ncbi:MAG: substrate-binding domain-containing protein [Chloroflexi bacterium]|nr:substrate-binding domain-containing protein [Chloroflexota bacterium]